MTLTLEHHVVVAALSRGYTHIDIRGGRQPLPATKAEIRDLLERRGFRLDQPVRAEDEDGDYVVYSASGAALLTLCTPEPEPELRVLVGVEDHRDEDDDAELLHVRWRHAYRGDDRGTRGLLAVRLTDDVLDVRVLAGHYPHIHVLIPAIDACFPEWRDRAAELHSQRVNPWAVHVRQGMSGCETYTLRSLRDPEWGDAPTHAMLHVSMAGKFAGVYGMWLGDLLPLLARVVELSEFIGDAGHVDLEIGLPFIDRHRLDWAHGTDADPLIATIDGWAS